MTWKELRAEKESLPATPFTCSSRGGQVASLTDRNRLRGQIIIPLSKTLQQKLLYGLPCG